MGKLTEINGYWILLKHEQKDDLTAFLRRVGDWKEKVGCLMDIFEDLGDRDSELYQSLWSLWLRMEITTQHTELFLQDLSVLFDEPEPQPNFVRAGTFERVYFCKQCGQKYEGQPPNFCNDCGCSDFATLEFD